jgi:hypothetical protein
MEETRAILTLGDVARRLDKSPHVVDYAIRTYRIEPRQRAGILRLWAEADVPTIAAAMRRVSERRGGRR